MKFATLLLVSALGPFAGGSALAADIEYDTATAHVRIYEAKPLIVIDQGVQPISIVAGKTNVGRTRTIKCRSAAGCLITAKIWASFSNMEFPTISAYLDGVAMEPTNIITGSMVLTAQQSALVPGGIHTMQVQVTQQTAQGEVTGWNFEYAKYERPTKLDGR